MESPDFFCRRDYKYLLLRWSGGRHDGHPASIHAVISVERQRTSRPTFTGAGMWPESRMRHTMRTDTRNIAATSFTSIISIYLFLSCLRCPIASTGGYPHRTRAKGPKVGGVGRKFDNAGVFPL